MKIPFGVSLETELVMQIRAKANREKRSLSSVTEGLLAAALATDAAPSVPGEAPKVTVSDAVARAAWAKYLNLTPIQAKVLRYEAGTLPPE